MVRVVRETEDHDAHELTLAGGTWFCQTAEISHFSESLLDLTKLPILPTSKPHSKSWTLTLDVKQPAKNPPGKKQATFHHNNNNHLHGGHQEHTPLKRFLLFVATGSLPPGSENQHSNCLEP